MTTHENASRNRYVQDFSVRFQYPVHFSVDVFHPESTVLTDVITRLGETRRHRAMVIIDQGVVDATPGIVPRVEAYAQAHRDTFELAESPVAVPGGEQSKQSWQIVEDLMLAIGRQHLCRQSVVIAVGGGSMLDVAGLATSLVHRGLRLIRVPTSVLSQNDAGVGVKNGIDAFGMKNFAGTFAPPFGVIIDNTFLHTLPERYWYGGLSEAFKVAIICDATFFRELEDMAPRLRARDEAAMAQTVRRSAILHLEHIRTSGDPFEFGEARPLDFGHWAAHRLEMLSGYELGHGQAVGIGIALDTYYACEQGMLTTTERDRILGAMDTAGVMTWSPRLEQRTAEGTLEILRGLEEFREHLGGRLHVTLPHQIGSKQEVQTMDPETIEEGVCWLGARNKERT